VSLGTHGSQGRGQSFLISASYRQIARTEPQDKEKIFNQTDTFSTSHPTNLILNIQSEVYVLTGYQVGKLSAN